ncbi:hypothetical protein GOBAR_AA39889 [Gossypium barbadense]|uniref:Uncharacterized protein n=1 Tax=Gossypium barbadense TaxID=3634 RepID=A0A2P5VPQ8_GOSBA|nr:hypothetical protein GOBAR_AA39889 [Gossypium barbadense]
MSISPSLSPRQCPNHYTFRAGRNLPDKKFRYLRTVIVTAAVHWGFGHRLPCHQVTNFLDLPALGRRQPPYMFPGPDHCDPFCEEAPLLPKLRGYFAEFLRESCYSFFYFFFQVQDNPKGLRVFFYQFEPSLHHPHWDGLQGS